MKNIMRVKSSETGIAMVTVLFVGAALTAVASVAAFTTVRELQAGGDDRRASEAVAVAEAGIDRFVEYVKSGDVHWGRLRLAGCDAAHPEVVVKGRLGPQREFESVFEVYNPHAANAAERVAPAACVGTEANPRHPSPKEEQFFAITSTGTAPSATRVVRQVVRIGTVGLPIGVYAEGLAMNGNPDFIGVSYISRYDVEGREKMSFSGTDPYYTLNDFWPGLSDGTHMPASVHSLGKIFLKKLNQENSLEHPPTLNCTANQAGGTKGQSMWDQSSGGGTISAACTAPNAWPGSSTGTDVPPGPAAGEFPPTSFLSPAVFDEVVPQPALSDQDYLALKASAQSSGLYCFVPASGTKQCSRLGASWPNQDGTTGTAVSVSSTDTAAVTSSSPSFVTFIEFEDETKAMTGNQLVFETGANVWPCSDNLEQHRSVVIVVRNGSYGLGTGNVQLNGLLVAPEGEVRLRGGHEFQGTIIAKSANLQGDAVFRNQPCWVRNMPGPFLSVTPAGWAEVDRP